MKQALVFSTRAAQCPLSSQEVYGVVAACAAAIPLSTKDITEKCVAAFPHYPNIRPYKVLLHLEYLTRAGRVISYHGGTDPQRLEELGVKAPHSRHRYWVSQQTSPDRPESC